MMLVVWWFGQTGAAGPAQPPPEPVTEIEIVPSVVEGPVKLVFAGREGDQVFVDEWNAGALPLETQLAGGLHTFRVEGAKGKVTVQKVVDVVPGQVVTVDLTPPPPPAPAPAPVPPATPANPTP
jgi:hypothetical protein